MEFLGVGPLELLVILAITLIVVGPHRLPEMAAQLARLLRTLRKISADLTREFNETLQELEHEYEDLQGEWKEIGQGLEEETKAVEEELEAAEREAAGPEPSHDGTAQETRPAPPPPR